MSVGAGQAKRQITEQEQAVPLADLMQSDSHLEPDYKVIKSNISVQYESRRQHVNDILRDTQRYH